MVKKTILTDISIIYSIIMQWESILWWAEGIFLQNLKSKGEGLVSICSNFDFNGCFDLFYQFVFTKRVPVKNYNWQYQKLEIWQRNLKFW